MLIPNLKERHEIVFKGADPYEDIRGVIENYQLPEAINLVATITSKKGTIRSNHYHPVQEQKVLLISGKYISIYKDLLYQNSPIKHHLISAGDLVITPPMVVHTMIFLEDSVFINLVNGNRDHNKFGEHTIPFVLVKQEEKEDYIKKYDISKK